MRIAKFCFLLFCLHFPIEGQTILAQDSTIVVASDSAVELKILSWNIWMLPPFIYRTDKRGRAKMIGDLLAESDYDILVFQETFHHGARRRLKSRLKHNFPYRKGPANRNYISIKTHSGIWIWSKVPIEKLKQIKFKKTHGLDNKMARKGALMVQGEKDGQRFQVIGTHLNAGGPFFVKLSQVKQIREELMDRYRLFNVPQFICGDFNIHKKNPDDYARMMEILEAKDGELLGDIKFTCGLKRQVGLKVQTGQCAEDRPVPDVIDYIFVKPNNCKIESVERKVPQISSECPFNDDLSDHQPVEGHIIFQ